MAFLNRAGKRFYQRSANVGAPIMQTIRTMPKANQMVGGMAALGVGALCMYGYSQPANYVPGSTRDLMAQFGGAAYAKRVRSRIMNTYGHLAAGLGMTAGFAVAAFRGGLAHRMMNMNPMLLMGGTMMGCIGLSMMTQSTPYDNPMKYVWWTGFNAFIGLSLVPMGMLGGALVSQAAVYTAMIVGSLSLVAAASPSDQFLSMGPMLGCGLGVVMAASIGSAFFPASSMLYNVGLYGGLGVFGLFICYDTQKILYHAQMDKHFDPINREIGIYMHTINIFIRVAQILAMSQGRRKK